MDMAVVDYMMYLAYSETKLALLLSFSQYEYMQLINNFLYFAIKKSINLRKNPASFKFQKPNILFNFVTVLAAKA